LIQRHSRGPTSPNGEKRGPTSPAGEKRDLPRDVAAVGPPVSDVDPAVASIPVREAFSSPATQPRCPIVEGGTDSPRSIAALSSRTASPLLEDRGQVDTPPAPLPVQHARVPPWASGSAVRRPPAEMESAGATRLQMESVGATRLQPEVLEGPLDGAATGARPLAAGTVGEAAAEVAQASASAPQSSSSAAVETAKAALLSHSASCDEETGSTRSSEGCAGAGPRAVVRAALVKQQLL